MRVLIYVEGQTEEVFINNCLAPYLRNFNIFMTPIVVSTKILLNGGKIVGGLTNGNLPTFLQELNKLILTVGQDGIVTTFIDYYAIPSEFPGYKILPAAVSSETKVDFLQNKLSEYYNFDPKFLPYIMMHEFEALLFSHPCGFQNYLDPSKGDINSLVNIVKTYDNPELINDLRETSPSHRILNAYPSFKKPLLGNMIALEIGIDQLLARCTRFRTWVESLIARS